jgi:perosamine synthetase
MIPVCGSRLWGNEAKYLQECIDTAWLSSLGPFVKKFENEFSKKIGVKHGIACSNGTAGLYVAVHALGIGEGDEVIIPDFSIIVSANTIIMNGAKPVLVDVLPDTWCIDPDKIEQAITKKTKAIMVVHMYGHPADMDRINSIARKHNLYVIEDCCQSHGAQYNNTFTGALSDISVFSFYANKILTCGEGGMILTNNSELDQKIRCFIDNGFQIPRFIHHVVGFNFRLTNLQAAVGLAQTENLELAVARKREIAEKYMTGFKDFPHVQLPVELPYAKNVFWMFCILVRPSFGRTKEEVISALRERGVDTRSFFFGMHTQPAYQKERLSNYPDIDGSFPVSDDIARRGLYLPSGLDLTDEQIETCIAEVITLKQSGS